LKYSPAEAMTWIAPSEKDADNSAPALNFLRFAEVRFIAQRARSNQPPLNT
jgi:hypothetical protein